MMLLDFMQSLHFALIQLVRSYSKLSFLLETIFIFLSILLHVNAA